MTSCNGGANGWQAQGEQGRHGSPAPPMAQRLRWRRIGQQVIGLALTLGLGCQPGLSLAQHPPRASDVRVARALMPRTVRKGALLWQSQVGGDRFSGPVFYDHQLFLTTQHSHNNGAIGGSHLLALDVRGGKIKWSLEHRSPLTRPTMASGKVVIADEAGVVEAFDSRSSASRWHVTLSGPIKLAPVAVGASETALDKVLVATGNHVVGLELSSGKTLWQVQTPSPVQWLGAATAGGGRGVVVLEDGQVLGLDARDGKVGWTFTELGGGRVMAAVSDGLVVVGGRAPSVQGLDVVNGSRRWTSNLTAPLDAAPLADAGRVALSLSSHSVTVLSLDNGHSRWSMKHEEPVSPLLLAAEATLIVKSGTGMVSLLDLDSGRMLWRIESDKTVLNLPAATDNGLLYFLSAGGILNAAGGPDYNGPPDEDLKLLE